MKYTLIYIALAILMSYSLAEDYIQYERPECDPKQNCEAADAGDKVRDPSDCHNYYICIRNETGSIVPSDDPFSCGIGEYFNATSECDTEDEPCVNPCVQYDCPAFCSSNEYERIAFPGDCTRFKECYPSGDTVTHVCPDDDPFFDGSYCSSDPYSCCDICTPYCVEEFTETPDPLDCYSFYFCSKSDMIPSEDDHLTCPEGMYFDPEYNSCADQTTTPACNQLCGIATTTSGTNAYSSTYATTIPPTTTVSVLTLPPN